MTLKVTIFAALLSTSLAARHRAHAAEPEPGTVAELYTWGSPKVSTEELENKATSDGCFPGLRVVTINGTDGGVVDIVPAFGVVLRHTKMKTLYLDEDGLTHKLRCGEKSRWLQSPNLDIHMPWHYLPRIVAYNGDAGLTVASNLYFPTAYSTDLTYVKEEAAKHGWRLIATSSHGEDLSHLFQDPDTGACGITFEGSDSWSDWKNNLDILPLQNFCGLGETFHNGFTIEVKAITSSDSWQTNIKPKLSGCSSVTSTGHSLGGAQATLFAACVNSRNFQNDDYKIMGFNKGEEIIFPEI
eukprot:353891_1